ncbi:MAG TPA: endonuclease/exonuclease/phosphatase family protein [Cyclobacteriaceae bacterium]|nr:endonuclease/exonuclease/phosphatase family protein [Cyclobacteriaceae bacterium]
MTYNIRLDSEKDGVNAWPNRKGKVFELIRKYDPDILGVQEALHHQLQDLIANLKDYSYVGVGRDDGKEAGEYSAILIRKDRFDIKEKGTFWLSETPEVPGSKSWDAAITRVASWAKLIDTNLHKEFLIANTHFDHIGKEARKNSAQLIKDKIGIIGKNLPTILTGDFNCTRKDPPYEVLMKPGGLKLIDPAPSPPPGTFCSFEVGSIECNPIDYIFFTPAWSASNYTVIKDNDGKYYPSDHLPVFAELHLVD